MIRHGGERPARTGRRRATPRPEPVASLVWIDAREAIVLHWESDAVTVRRLESDVPAHHHSTGHVRHEPAPGNAGAGPPRTAGESHRIEHLVRFVDEAAGAVPGAGDVLVVGPGTVHERLAERLAAIDARFARTRAIATEAAEHRTERQLIARLRELAGAAPRRRIRPGPRRTAAPIRLASGARPRATPRPFEPGVRHHAEGDLELDEDDGLDEPDEGSDEEFDAAIGFAGAAVGAGAGPGEPGSA